MSGQFIALSVSLDVIRALRPIVARLRTVDADLAKQIVRAGSSVTMNLSEGSKRAGRDQLHFFRIAAGSAAEVRTGIDTADAWGHLERLDLAPLLALFDRQAALLHRLSRREQ